jgi:Uma2 family endonuclease
MMRRWKFMEIRQGKLKVFRHMSTRTLITAQEFAQMITPETEDYELVEGELIALPGATPMHARIRQNVERLISNYFERNPHGAVFGEVDCRITDDTVRRPDASIFLGGRSQQLDLNKIPVPFAPDIAVEVLSPSESAIDEHRRVRDYLGAGSREVWILDRVNGELFVHTADGIRLLLGNDVLESPLLPGFSAPVLSLLAGL